jgi:hypothetical protein
VAAGVLRFLYRRRRARQPRAWFDVPSAAPSHLAARASHAIVGGMADQRALDAISRIDRALARIERSASRPRPDPIDGEEVERLRAAHESLRRKVAGAIGQLDLIIESEEA